MRARTVVFGLLGAKLDAGKGEDRWQRWRPTVALCQHEDFLIDRFELLYEPKLAPQAEAVAQDMQSVSPETEVRLHEIGFSDPWDLEEVYSKLHGFFGGYAFQAEEETYLLNITTGSHVQQICLFLLAESRHVPGQLLQASPPKRDKLGCPFREPHLLFRPLASQAFGFPLVGVSRWRRWSGTQRRSDSGERRWRVRPPAGFRCGRTASGRG